MGRPAIPAYGKYFRWEPVSPDFEKGLASRQYVMKANPEYAIRSNLNSEKWFIIYQGNVVVAEGHGPFNTMREAMEHLVPGSVLNA